MTQKHDYIALGLWIPVCWTDFVYQGVHYRRFTDRFYAVTR